MKLHFVIVGTLVFLAGCPWSDQGGGDAGQPADSGTGDRRGTPNGNAQPHSVGSVLAIANDYVGANIDYDGRFNVGAFQPAQWDLLYGWPDPAWTSGTVIRIDGVPCNYGDDACTGAEITESPVNRDATTNVSAWKVGPIAVVQTLHLTTGLGTDHADTVKIQYDITNSDTVQHSVGVRLLLDTEINGDDGALFWIPGLANVVANEAEWDLPNIPLYYQAFGDLADRTHIAEGILGALDATIPDRFLIVSWNDFSSTTWDYTVSASNQFLSGGYPDSAVALYWNASSLAAGASRSYITYYGIGDISGTGDLGLTGPTQLAAVTTHWAPNPFTVVGYLKNSSGLPKTGESLTLALTAGLALATGETATHPLPDIPAGQAVGTSWGVVGVASGTWPYAAADGSSPPLAAQRSIVLPPVWQCTPAATQACTTTSLGVCAAGQQICNSAGVWGPCVQNLQPAPENCNDGIDNDCDGLVDSADPDCWACSPATTQACTTNQPGPCAAGQQTCSSTGAWGPCVGTVPPSPEVCNDGIDNDCDGLVDSADPDCRACTAAATRVCATSKPGACAAGQQTCSSAGAWGPCVQNVQPSPEVCTDGIDNDCDGLVDSADPDCRVCTFASMQWCTTTALGVCAKGQQTCNSAGVWGPCVQTTQPSCEVCNDGLDNDCDGLVDSADPDCQVTCPLDFLKCLLAPWTPGCKR
jgi:hypothetical protein